MRTVLLSDQQSQNNDNNHIILLQESNCHKQIFVCVYFHHLFLFIVLRKEKAIIWLSSSMIVRVQCAYTIKPPTINIDRIERKSCYSLTIIQKQNKIIS